MRIYKLLLLILILVSARVSSQNNTYQLRVDFGKRVWQTGNVQNTLDGGIIVCGTLVDNLGSYSFLVKISEFGQEQWKQTYITNTLSCTGKFVIQTVDGGYMMVGEQYTANQDKDIFIIRTDSIGNVIWNKAYGNNANDYGNNLIPLPSGNFLVCGEIDSIPKIGTFLRINPNGDVLETKYLGLAFAQSTIKGKLVSSNLIIVTGSGVTEIFTDTSGNYLGQSNLQLSDSANTTDVLITPSGDHVTLANMYYGGSSNLIMYFLTKSDSTATLPPAWINKFGIAPTSVFATTLLQATDGTFMIAGGISPFFAPGFLFLTKVDTTGIPIWMIGYAPENSPDFNAGGAIATPDGGYILTGAGFVGSGKYDLFVIKTDSVGNSGCFQSTLSLGLFAGNYSTPVQLAATSDSLQNSGTPISITNSTSGSWSVLCYTSTEDDEQHTNESMTLYPNPFGSLLNFDTSKEPYGPYELIIYDMMGAKKINLFSDDATWSGTELELLPEGLYIGVVKIKGAIRFRSKLVH